MEGSNGDGEMVERFWEMSRGCEAWKQDEWDERLGECEGGGGSNWGERLYRGHLRRIPLCERSSDQRDHGNESSNRLSSWECVEYLSGYLAEWASS